MVLRHTKTRTRDAVKENRMLQDAIEHYHDLLTDELAAESQEFLDRQPCRMSVDQRHARWLSNSWSGMIQQRLELKTG